VPIYKAIEG